MLRMSRITDYGIVLLSHLAAADPERVHNARELAESAHLPLPVVSKILKVLARDLDVPILALSTPYGGIVSSRPDLLERVRSGLGPTATDRPLGPAEFTRLHQLARLAIPYAYSLSGHVLYTDAEHFQPRSSRAVQLDRRDVRGTDLRRRFDGEIFVIWSVRGEIASWSAIKLKSPDVWEIAVVTEAPFRGQGLAKEVVSAATAYILEQGRMALYVHDRTNLASAKVCRSLGYVEYAEEFFSEY